MLEFEVSTEAFSAAASHQAAAASDPAGAAAALASSDDAATPTGGAHPAASSVSDASAPPAASGKVQVLITFTSSYDGWGQARVSCVSGGCTCTPQVSEEIRVEAGGGLHLHSSGE